MVGLLDKLRRSARGAKYTVGADLVEWLLTHTSVLDGDQEPPGFINFAGGGDFVRIGDRIVQQLIDFADLVEEDKVLEIGCGIGRNAMALSRRMPRIHYFGFDIVRFGISWCQKQFRELPSFIFSHADVRNTFYNPRGRINAARYTFESQDQVFDLIFATSVFTHMQADDVARYLRESWRCLRPGGRCFFTCFLIDEESTAKIQAGESSFSFKHPVPGGRTEFELEPDVAVAYERAILLKMIASAGLQPLRFEPGSWRGDRTRPDFQDAFVLTRLPTV